MKEVRELDSRRSTRTSLASLAKLPSPAVSTIFSDSTPAQRTTPLGSANGLDDIAPEIVVWTGDMDDMVVDSPAPATPATRALGEQTLYVLVAQLHPSRLPLHFFAHDRVLISDHVRMLNHVVDRRRPHQPRCHQPKHCRFLYKKQIL